MNLQSGYTLDLIHFSAPASTSRRCLGGRPPRRSTSPVTMSNAPAAKLAWMLTTVLTAPAGRPAFVSPARSCFSVMARNASDRPVISAMRAARSAPDRRSGPGSVVDRACMAVAYEDSDCGGRHVTARNESNPVLGQPGQHALVQRRLCLLHETFGIVVHTQDGPRRRRGDKMLLAPPVGGTERRLLLLPRARRAVARVPQPWPCPNDRSHRSHRFSCLAEFS